MTRSATARTSFEHLALAARAVEQRAVPGQRVRPPRLGEAADERLLLGVQEEHRVPGHAAAQPAEDLREARREAGIAHVEDDADAGAP